MVLLLQQTRNQTHSFWQRDVKFCFLAPLSPSAAVKGPCGRAGSSGVGKLSLKTPCLQVTSADGPQAFVLYGGLHHLADNICVNQPHTIPLPLKRAVITRSLLTGFRVSVCTMEWMRVIVLGQVICAANVLLLFIRKMNYRNDTPK